MNSGTLSWALSNQVNSYQVNSSHFISSSLFAIIAPNERAPLQQREFKVDFASKVGQVKMMAATSDASKGGFYCDTCDCVMRDSATFTDHINGRKRTAFSPLPLMFL